MLRKGTVAVGWLGASRFVSSPPPPPFFFHTVAVLQSILLFDILTFQLRRMLHQNSSVQQGLNRPSKIQTCGQFKLCIFNKYVQLFLLSKWVFFVYTCVTCCTYLFLIFMFVGAKYHRTQQTPALKDRNSQVKKIKKSIIDQAEKGSKMTLHSVSFSKPQLQRSLQSPAKLVSKNHRCAPSKRLVRATAETAEQTQTAEDKSSKSLQAMKKFSEQYCKRTDTYFCSDLTVTAVVIKGLAEHKDELGAPLCPCRHYDDKQAEAKQGYWNCPCVPMRERKECHCMLFLTDDNPFVGKEQSIDMDVIVEATEGM
eukprot:TRINITY_DN1984_c0_g1_i3.p1 TRINITY_DN1984_c0_g1~~TRINITY_DN1984_c0_g1_i3.p1  ORF type:complete len:311 (-),score=24.51 TRINITY_DN1984_c0_g1_i3:98-1030(-)